MRSSRRPKATTRSSLRDPENPVGGRLPAELRDPLAVGQALGLDRPARRAALREVEGPARRVRRQRINDNLLGERSFCPTIRRTDTLRGFEAADLPVRPQMAWVRASAEAGAP